MVAGNSCCGGKIVAGKSWCGVEAGIDCCGNRVILYMLLIVAGFEDFVAAKG